MKIVTSGILDSLRVCLIRLRSGLSSFFITEEDRDSPDRLKEDLEAENGPKADPALIETISRNVGPAADWLFNDLKVEFTKRPCPDFSKTDPRRTGSFVKCIDNNALFFLQQFQKLGGLVLTETNMTNLLTEKGRVSGIEYSCPEEKNKKLLVSDVILATGAYGADASYYPKSLDKVLYYGTKEEDGLGMQIALKHGASLINSMITSFSRMRLKLPKAFR